VALGSEVHWDEALQAISHRNHAGIAGTFVVDNESTIIFHNRAFVQLGALGEGLGVGTYWDSETSTAVLTAPLT